MYEKIWLWQLARCLVFLWNRELITASHRRCNPINIKLQQWERGTEKLLHELQKMFKFYIRKLLLLGEADPHSNLSDWMQHLYICEEISWTLSRKTAKQTAFSLLIVPERLRSRNQLRIPESSREERGLCVFICTTSLHSWAFCLNGCFLCLLSLWNLNQ